MNEDPTAYYVIKSKANDEVIFLMKAEDEIIPNLAAEKLFEALLGVVDEVFPVERGDRDNPR